MIIRSDAGEGQLMKVIPRVVANHNNVMLVHGKKNHVF
jgi:hypothetical protein